MVLQSDPHLQGGLQGLGHDGGGAGALQIEAVADVVRAHVRLDLGEVLVQRPDCAVVGACARAP